MRIRLFIRGINLNKPMCEMDTPIVPQVDSIISITVEGEIQSYKVWGVRYVFNEKNLLKEVNIIVE